MADEKKEEKEIKKVEQTKKVDFGGGITITGDVSGTAIGSGGVHASNIAGGNINIYHVSQENEDLVEYMMLAIERGNLSPEERAEAIELVELVHDLGYKADEKMLNFLVRSLKKISPSIFEMLVKKILTQENIPIETKRLIRGML